MAGITVSKAIAKWFDGKEMALAMGLEMAIARVGVFAIFSISPRLANRGEQGRSDGKPAENVSCLCLGYAEIALEHVGRIFLKREFRCPR